MAPRHEIVERPISALGVIAPPPIHVQTPTFDGSLAMLFKCVREHKVDLLDVPLFPICEAYFAYLIQTELPDLDEAAAALAALAYLLERKAWMLLPVAEPEPDLEEAMELPEPSSHEYRCAIDALRLWHEERSSLFFRSSDGGPNPYEVPYELEEVSASDLARAFERLLRKAEPEPVSIGKHRTSLAEQMALVLLAIDKEWRTLEALVPTPFTRSEAVYWFLALLELMRLGQVAAKLVKEEVVFAIA